MNFFTEEMYKGISDLPILLVAMVFSIFLRRFEEKKVWSQFFMLLAEAAFIGAAVHMLSLEGGYKKVAWAALYVLLYEVVRNLSIAINAYTIQEEVSFPKLLWVVQFAGFIASVVLLFKESKYDIYVFAGFAVLILVWVLAIAIKNKITVKLILFFVLALLAAVFQLGKDVIPFGVVWSHLAIIVAICVLFSIALDD